MLETDLINRTNRAIEDAETHGFPKTAETLKEVLRNLELNYKRTSDDRRDAPPTSRVRAVG